MKKRTFEKFINLSISKGKKDKAIYDNGLDLINFTDDYSTMNSILLNSIYGEETSSLISDFIFDSVYNELETNKSNYIIYDKDGKILSDCSTIDELYKYTEEVRLDLISSNYSYDIKEEMTDEARANLLEELKKLFTK
jgi:hypothetical protein